MHKNYELKSKTVLFRSFDYCGKNRPQWHCYQLAHVLVTHGNWFIALVNPKLKSITFREASVHSLSSPQVLIARKRAHNVKGFFQIELLEFINTMNTRILPLNFSNDRSEPFYLLSDQKFNSVTHNTKANKLCTLNLFGCSVHATGKSLTLLIRSWGGLSVFYRTITYRDVRTWRPPDLRKSGMQVSPRACIRRAMLNRGRIRIKRSTFWERLGCPTTSNCCRWIISRTTISKFSYNTGSTAQWTDWRNAQLSSGGTFLFKKFGTVSIFGEIVIWRSLSPVATLRESSTFVYADFKLSVILEVGAVLRKHPVPTVKCRRQFVVVRNWRKSLSLRVSSDGTYKVARHLSLGLGPSSAHWNFP